MSILMLLIAGCGSELGQTTAGGSARTKCQEWGIPAEEIDYAYQAFIAARDSGVAEFDVVQGLADVSAYATREASLCAMAIASDVYH